MVLYFHKNGDFQQQNFDFQLVLNLYKNSFLFHSPDFWWVETTNQLWAWHQVEDRPPQMAAEQTNVVR